MGRSLSGPSLGAPGPYGREVRGSEYKDTVLMGEERASEADWGRLFLAGKTEDVA